MSLSSFLLFTDYWLLITDYFAFGHAHTQMSSTSGKPPSGPRRYRCNCGPIRADGGQCGPLGPDAGHCGLLGTNGDRLEPMGTDPVNRKSLMLSAL